jgi:AcrR family transcriptional regulator
MAKKVAESHERILKAAAKLFRLKGFAATTVREIAQAADMLPGSLHYRYASKEEILIALMERGIEQATAAVRSALGSSNDAVEKARLALRAHMRMVLSGDDAVYVLLNEWRTLTGNALRSVIHLRDRYEAIWAKILSEIEASGNLQPTVDLKLVRLLGFGAVNSATQWFRNDGNQTPEEIADAFWAFMAFGVLKAGVNHLNSGDAHQHNSATNSPDS